MKTRQDLFEALWLLEENGLIGESEVLSIEKQIQKIKVVKELSR